MKLTKQSETLAKVLVIAFLLKMFFPEDVASGLFFGLMGIWLLLSVFRKK